MANQYVVLFDGRVWGPFTTNNASLNANNNDADYWSAHNCPGSPTMGLNDQATFETPVPLSETTG